MKNQEQIMSKLSECKRNLRMYEEEYEKKGNDKWLKPIYSLRGKAKVLRFLNCH